MGLSTWKFNFLWQQIIHQTNQQKSENELQLLNNMVNKAREVRKAFFFFFCRFSFSTAC